jgi:hypothetical protein
VAAVSDLAREFNIVYMTARRWFMRDKSRQWLERHGFPIGPILCRGPYMTSAGEFKRGVIADLRGKFPGIFVGIGDRAHDAHACLSNRIPAILFRPREVPPPGSRVCENWGEVPALVRELERTP